jgi:hypothetical protein
MGLREQAAADARTILNDQSGFGWPITLIRPDDAALQLVGFSTDVAQTIDPETGVAVSGRVASIAISIADLQDAGMEIPRGIAESSRKPWLVVFDDVNGHSHTFKISESNPDRALGVVTCSLEAFKPRT